MSIIEDYIASTKDPKIKDRLERSFLKKEKEILRLGNSVSYWANNLLERTINIFEYSGLPKDLKAKEIEKRLLIDGYVGFVNDPNYGFAVTRCGMVGVTAYDDEFTHFTYAGPRFKGGKVRIGKDGVIINNNSCRTSILPMIYRYADLLAHSELSLKSAMVASRRMDVFSVENDKTAENVRKFHDKLYQGEYDAIVDKSLVSSITNIGTSKINENAVMQVWEIRQELFRSYLNEIGIRVASDKRERMVVDEVSQDSMYLLNNVRDMEKNRQEGFDEVNSVFGLNIKAKLNPEFEYLTNPEKGVKQNDNKEISE